MTDPFTVSEISAIGSAKQTLARLVERAFAHMADAPAQPRHALRLEAPIEAIEPLDWLLLQGNRSRGFWEDRKRGFTLAGVGTADILTGEVQADVDALLARLRLGISTVHPNLRYYGGMRFDPRRAVSEEWLPFGAYRFVLPRFEVLRRGDQTYFACNIVLDAAHDLSLRDTILEQLDALPFPDGAAAPEAALPRVVSREDSPGREAWGSMIAGAQGAIDSGRLEKVVLARVSRLRFEARLDPIAILSRLAPYSRNCFHFCFQPKADTAFVGASPERLYKRSERHVQSEAVAGTRACGASREENARLEAELLASSKDRHEHRLVVESIRQILEARCHATHADAEADVLKLLRCQHLRTRLEGILRAPDSDADLLRALHPTPAVGGVPREAAIEWIAQAEPFDRGWYTGPVGWVSCDAAEFAVGIRSGLVRGDGLYLYAGAGIVAGSTADEEWDELENKIGNFVSVVRGEELPAAQVGDVGVP